MSTLASRVMLALASHAILVVAPGVPRDWLSRQGQSMCFSSQIRLAYLKCHLILTSAHTAADSICPLRLQAASKLQSGILHACDKHYDCLLLLLSDIWELELPGGSARTRSAPIHTPMKEMFNLVYLIPSPIQYLRNTDDTDLRYISLSEYMPAGAFGANF